MEPFRIQQQFTLHYEYPVWFTDNSFAPDNTLLIDLLDNLDESPKILAVIDQGVLNGNPQLPARVERYFQRFGVIYLPSITVLAGEACKNDEQVIDSIYQAVEHYAIDRHSYILVIGGGAVVDAIGFAAATAHRGIRLIRMPTTVLGQNDAGIGVKNAVNYHRRKNYIGTFAPPFAVVNDFALLHSLSARDKRSGMAEAVKVALIKDAPFFDELYQARRALAQFDDQAMRNMIIKGAQWHLRHIATSGDPFESGSARPLDFGHWSAHKLEALSGNQLRHGEAVAIGIALDSIYSVLAGHLSRAALERILALLTDIGFALNHPVLAELDIPQALAEFQEHLGGNLSITLLSDIGTGFEVNQVDQALMIAAIDELRGLH